MQLPPWPLEAIVISQDPDNYSLNVSIQGFLGGQMPSVPVKVMTMGARDAVLTNQPELPRRGTIGLVIFPRGDPRNGHWIGATDPAQIDASSHAPGLGNIAYSSHFGGGWSYRDQTGGIYEHFPDGTSVLVGSSVPVPTRHTLDGNQARQRTEFTQSQRVAQAPSGSFQALLNHPSGALANLNASGAWGFLAAPGQAVTLQVSGGAAVTLDGSGNILCIAKNGAEVAINANGNIILTPSQGLPVVVSGNLQVIGTVIGGFGGADQVGLASHSHFSTGASGSITTPPRAGT